MNNTVINMKIHKSLLNKNVEKKLHGVVIDLVTNGFPEGCTEDLLLWDEAYRSLYDYYLSTEEMPYGVARARTGDPEQWILDTLRAEWG